MYELFFKLQLLRYLGYQPITDYCHLCNTILQKACYDSKNGELVCNKCYSPNNDNFILEGGELEIIKYLSNTHIKNLKKSSSFLPEALQQIDKYLLYFISFHIINIQHIKSIQLNE